MRVPLFARLLLVPVAVAALVVILELLSGATDRSRAAVTSFAGPQIRQAVAHDMSPSLRVLAARVAAEPPVTPIREDEELPAGDLAAPSTVPRVTRRVATPQNLRYKAVLASNPFTLLRSFEGITTAETRPNTDCTIPNSCWSADASGAVGPNHYMQSVNFFYSIYKKDGTRILGPTSSAAFWNGFAAPCGGGWTDEVVLYDHQADRWFVSRFAQDPATNYWYECFAISTTPDPTDTYYRYAFLISKTEFNDYPKFGIWPDAYYMTSQRNKIFAGLGLFVTAFERSKMLTGQPAQMVQFTLDNNGTCDSNGNNCDHRAGMLPADWDGQTPPPANGPNYLVRPLSSTLGWPSPDALELWAFHVDWGNPGASTLALTDTLDPTPYQPACGFDQSCVPQPNTATRLDPLATGYLMYRLAYRNFGGHEALVLNQTVDEGDLTPDVHVGIRWYELRRTGGPWSIFQQGDYAPDSDHRWIGSIAMDRVGDIALGYNVSSSTRYPSIAYAGRLPGDPSGTLSQEATLQPGGGSQKGFIFWSDYSQLTLDPTDDCTFWYVNGYQPADSDNQGWATHIGAWRSPTCPKATTAITYTGATTEDYNDQTTLSATLTNTFDGLPVFGGTLTFSLDGQSCTDSTNASGHASCHITPNEPAGSYPLTVAFAGTSQLEPATFNGNFAVTHEETTLDYTGPTLIPNQGSVQLSGILREDGATPIAGRMVTFTLGSGPGAQSCSDATDLAGVAECTISPVTQPLGAGAVSAGFAGDAFYLPSSDSASTIVFAFLAKGSFVVGDQSAAGSVTFWSQNWSSKNVLSGGAAPDAFKGFAATLSATPPACGITWTTGPGAGASPPATVPAYMAVIAASSVTKSGVTISGNAPSLVIVKTDPGYAPNPGHPGTGTVVATLCP
jgi:hypothetical protein